MYEPQKPQLARAMTGKGIWYIEPTAPLAAMTKDMMKNERATMPSDSRQERPTAMMLDANCQVAALKASEIQYAIAGSVSIFNQALRWDYEENAGRIQRKLRGPQSRPARGTGSRSRFVQRALPLANADCDCATRRRG